MFILSQAAVGAIGLWTDIYKLEYGQLTSFYGPHKLSILQPGNCRDRISLTAAMESHRRVLHHHQRAVHHWLSWGIYSATVKENKVRAE